MHRLSLRVHLAGYEVEAPKGAHTLEVGKWHRLYRFVCRQPSVRVGNALADPGMKASISLINQYSGVSFPLFIRNLYAFLKGLPPDDLKSFLGLLKRPNVSCRAHISVGDYWKLASDRRCGEIFEAFGVDLKAATRSQDQRGEWTGGFPQIKSILDDLKTIRSGDYYLCAEDPKCREELAQAMDALGIYDDLPLQCRSLLKVLASRGTWNTRGVNYKPARLLEETGLVIHQDNKYRFSSKALEIYVYDNHTWRGKLGRSSRALEPLGKAWDSLRRRAHLFFQNSTHLAISGFVVLLSISAYVWYRDLFGKKSGHTYVASLILASCMLVLGILLGLLPIAYAQRLDYRIRHLPTSGLHEPGLQKDFKRRWSLSNSAALFLVGLVFLSFYYTFLEHESSEWSPNPEVVGLRIHHPPWMFSRDRSSAYLMVANCTECTISGKLQLTLLSNSIAAVALKPKDIQEFGPVLPGRSEVIGAWEIETAMASSTISAMNFKVEFIDIETNQGCLQEIRSFQKKAKNRLEMNGKVVKNTDFSILGIPRPWRVRELLESNLAKDMCGPLALLVNTLGVFWSGPLFRRWLTGT